MAEKPIRCSFDIIITILECFDTFFLWETHRCHHSYRFSWWTISWATSSCSFRNSKWPLNIFIAHMFEVPCYCCIGIIISTIVEGMFSRIFRDTHLQDLVQKSLVKLWLLWYCFCLWECYFAFYWLTIIGWSKSLKINGGSFWYLYFYFELLWNPIVINKSL